MTYKNNYNSKFPKKFTSFDDVYYAILEDRQQAHKEFGAISSAINSIKYNITTPLGEVITIGDPSSGQSLQGQIDIGIRNGWLPVEVGTIQIKFAIPLSDYKVVSCFTVATDTEIGVENIIESVTSAGVSGFFCTVNHAGVLYWQAITRH